MNHSPNMVNWPLLSVEYNSVGRRFCQVNPGKNNDGLRFNVNDILLV